MIVLEPCVPYQWQISMFFFYYIPFGQNWDFQNSLPIFNYSIQ